MIKNEKFFYFNVRREDYFEEKYYNYIRDLLNLFKSKEKKFNKYFKKHIGKIVSHNSYGISFFPNKNKLDSILGIKSYRISKPNDFDYETYAYYHLNENNENRDNFSFLIGKNYNSTYFFINKYYYYLNNGNDDFIYVMNVRVLYKNEISLFLKLNKDNYLELDIDNSINQFNYEWKQYKKEKRQSRIQFRKELKLIKKVNKILNKGIKYMKEIGIKELSKEENNIFKKVLLERKDELKNEILNYLDIN